MNYSGRSMRTGSNQRISMVSISISSLWFVIDIWCCRSDYCLRLHWRRGWLRADKSWWVLHEMKVWSHMDGTLKINLLHVVKIGPQFTFYTSIPSKRLLAMWSILLNSQNSQSYWNTSRSPDSPTDLPPRYTVHPGPTRASPLLFYHFSVFYRLLFHSYPPCPYSSFYSYIAQPVSLYMLHPPALSISQHPYPIPYPLFYLQDHLCTPYLITLGHRATQKHPWLPQ